MEEIINSSLMTAANERLYKIIKDFEDHKIYYVQWFCAAHPFVCIDKGDYYEDILDHIMIPKSKISPKWMWKGKNWIFRVFTNYDDLFS